MKCSLQHLALVGVLSLCASAAQAKTVTNDFDGDAKADITTYRSSTGAWTTLLSGTNYTTSLQLTVPSASTPVPGDYDGDGKTDVAVYQPSGLWVVYLSRTNYTTTWSMPYGLSTDIPVPGDYDG